MIIRSFQGTSSMCMLLDHYEKALNTGVHVDEYTIIIPRGSFCGKTFYMDGVCVADDCGRLCLVRCVTNELGLTDCPIANCALSTIETDARLVQLQCGEKDT